MKRKIRIANAGGYWGDDLGAMKRQLTGGKVDYITQDFLAEITMSILMKQKQRNPQFGYAYDFITQMEECLPLIVKKGVKVISNAGGVNPIACGEKVLEIARKLSLNVKVGVVHGDDIIDSIDRLCKSGEKFRNMETGGKFAGVRKDILSANVYFGAEPVVEALRADCQIIICGRVTDTSVTMAPMIYEFGWEMTDWDKLAAGIVAGHIIECGAQSSGGNITDWEEVKTFANMGYPIIEAEPSGEFVVTKQPKAGGLVSEKTVKEQLLYEMGDPMSYITPDVIARFDTIHLEEVAPNHVRVSGVKGEPPTPYLKVSMSHDDGWKASGALLVCGPDVLKKADAFARMFWKRLGRKFEATRVETIGAGSIWPESLTPKGQTPNEILLRFGVRDQIREKVREFGVLLPSMILSGPSGVAVTGGRPKPEQVVAYWPALMSRNKATARVLCLDCDGLRTERIVKFPLPGKPGTIVNIPKLKLKLPPSNAIKVKVKLRQLAYARSGDKGDMCNIGVLARSVEIYAWLRKYLTTPKVKAFFKGITRGNVTRFEVENLLALNYLLDQSLGGGGTRSLMVDPQGKTLSQALLEMEINAPRVLLDTIKKPRRRKTGQAPSKRAPSKRKKKVTGRK